MMQAYYYSLLSRVSSFILLCILVHHTILEMRIEFPQVVLLLPLFTTHHHLLKHLGCSYLDIHHVCDVAPCFFIYPACYYRLIDISPKCMTAPAFLLWWVRRDRIPPTIKWFGDEKFGILSEYPCTIQQTWLFRVFGWTCHTRFCKLP